MNNNFCGKIIISKHRGVLSATFSPTCCFNPSKPRDNVYSLSKGCNEVRCKCGRIYHVNISGEFNDFENIARYEVTNKTIFSNIKALFGGV